MVALVNRYCSIININFETMRYLITTKGNKPYMTDWFDAENNFNDELQMVVYDLVAFAYMTDGINWKPIEFDNL